jgi:hypothetical protein
MVIQMVRNGSGAARVISGSARTRLLAPAVAGVGLIAGCGAAHVAPEDEPASLKAVLAIERVEDAAHGDAPSASALAHFVILPEDADADETLHRAGLRSQLPATAGCTVSSLDGAGSIAGRAPVGRDVVELLDAGNVSIQAGDAHTSLVLNVFPGSGSAAGVLYTTPDRSATPLPTDSLYTIDVTGSETIPRLRIEGRSPEALSEVRLNDAPLGDGASLIAGESAPVSWREGEAGDRVYVEVSDGEARVLCSFADDLGAGAIPGSLTALLSTTSPAWLSVSRVREAIAGQESLPGGAPMSDKMVLESMMRFDFQLSTTVRIDELRADDIHADDINRADDTRADDTRADDGRTDEGRPDEP